jgi:hypothetical protein
MKQRTKNKLRTIGEITAAILFLAIVALIAVIGAAMAQQQTIYSNDGNVVGRYTTDSQGTTTLYGRDGRVISRGTGTIVMDGVGGTIIPDKRSPYVGGKIRKDKR